jgi:hypothetical protein
LCKFSELREARDRLTTLKSFGTDAAESAKGKRLRRQTQPIGDLVNSKAQTKEFGKSLFATADDVAGSESDDESQGEGGGEEGGMGDDRDQGKRKHKLNDADLYSDDEQGEFVMLGILKVYILFVAFERYG